MPTGAHHNLTTSIIKCVAHASVSLFVFVCCIPPLDIRFLLSLIFFYQSYLSMHSSCSSRPPPYLSCPPYSYYNPDSCFSYSYHALLYSHYFLFLIMLLNTVMLPFLCIIGIISVLLIFIRRIRLLILLVIILLRLSTTHHLIFMVLTIILLVLCIRIALLSYIICILRIILILPIRRRVPLLLLLIVIIIPLLRLLIIIIILILFLFLCVYVIVFAFIHHLQSRACGFICTNKGKLTRYRHSKD